MNILIHSAEETFLHVGALISISILLFGYINHITSGKFVDLISYNKNWQPLIGAIMGALPGCGVQIIVMSFYLKGSLPFAALVANTISQDGDALFPLIAMNKKAAIWSTLITTIPATIVGLVIYINMI